MIDEPTPEQVAAAIKANPMRLMCYLRCHECGTNWRQPKDSGACPQCHSTRTECYLQQPMMAKRA